MKRLSRIVVDSSQLTFLKQKIIMFVFQCSCIPEPSSSYILLLNQGLLEQIEFHSCPETIETE